MPVLSAFAPLLRFALANRPFLAFGFVMTLGSSFGQTYFIGLFSDAIRDAFALSAGQYGALYSGGTLASALTLVWLGKRIDRLDLRLYALLVCLGLVLACLLLATALAPAMLVVAFFALRLSGQGLMTHTAHTAMGRYFDHERGKALSLAALGHSVGEAILPLPAVALLAWLGWRGAWLTFAAVVALALIPLVQALLIGHGSRHRAYLAQQEAGQEDGEGTGARAPGDQGRAAGAGGAELRQWSRGEALRDPRFYLVLLPVLGPGLIGTAVFFHQAELARAQGWTLSYFAGQFPVFAGFTIAASLSAGVLVDWLTARRLASVVCLPMAAGLLLIAASAHPAVAPVFMALMGVSMGLVLATMGAVWPELYGTRHLGAIRSLVMASVVLATAIAPILTGVLIDLGVSWAAIALGYAAYALGASAAALPVGGRLAG